MKLVILGNPKACERDEAKFKDAGIELVRCPNREELPEASKGAKVIMSYGMGLKADVINQLDDTVKCIIQMFIGLDNYDIEAATARGIMVCNNPNYGIQEVAIHAFAMYLAAERRICIYDRQMKEGAWPIMTQNFKPYASRRISKLTYGVIGFGGIGQNSASYAKGVGMNVVVYSPHCPDDICERCGVKKVSLDELFAVSDVIALHTPLRPSSHHMINKETIAKMKNGVIIVNTARGPLIDEDALYEALKSGKVAAAALDVFEKEPVKDGSSPLVSLENVIASPHSAYLSTESFNDIENLSTEIAIMVFNGMVPNSCVNKKELGLI